MTWPRIPRSFGALVMVLTLALTQAALAGTPVKPLTSMEKNIETVGTGISIALPLTAAGIALYRDDRTGLAQLTVETLLTLGTVYGLNHVVREKRPDGSDWHSFPSNTTALAASGSSFLWGRYGWQFGLPAFAMTEFVSYSRIQAKQHHWYDTVASSAIAAGYGYVITTPFRKRWGVDTQLSAAPDGASLQMSYNF